MASDLAEFAEDVAYQFGWDGEKADMPDWVTDTDNELPL